MAPLVVAGILNN